MRRFCTTLFTTFVGLGLALGCDLEDELAEQPCLDAADCWHGQECVRTPAEDTAGLPGVCLPDGADCLVGEQLGCECMPDAALSCSLSRPTPDGYPEMGCHPEQLVCVNVTDLPPEENE